MIATVAIILAELALVLATALGIVISRSIKRRKQDKEAVNSLLKNIRDKSSQRQQKLTTLLMKSQSCEDEVAINMATDAIKKQNEFYQSVIDLYYTRNHNLLGKLDERLEAVLDRYRDIISNQESGDKTISEEQTREIMAIKEQIEALRTENSLLLKELDATRRELDQMSNEYLSAFNKKKMAEKNLAKAAPGLQGETGALTSGYPESMPGEGAAEQDADDSVQTDETSLAQMARDDAAISADLEDSYDTGIYEAPDTDTGVELPEAAFTSHEQDTQDEELLHVDVDELLTQTPAKKTPSE